MTKSVSEIADAIREAGPDRLRSSELMATLYQETIELQHVPPRPGDGPIKSSTLVALAGQEVEALQRALPDASVHPPGVTVEDQRIRVRGRIDGTASDGSTVAVSTNTVFTVSDGRIVALCSEMDADAMQAWVRVLAAGADTEPSGPGT
jgi:SnoaL-like domain